jgi:hypothetical protein
MRGELDRRLVEQARGLLSGALLLVGGRSSLLAAVSTSERPEDVQPAAHDGVLWVGPAEPLVLRLGLRDLRKSLRPGARVVLAVRKHPPLLQRVRGLLGGPAPRPIHLEALCGALLASGLAVPRVHEAPRGWHLLSATLPDDPCALDAFFTQPLPG